MRKIKFPKMPDGVSAGAILAGTLQPPNGQGVTFAEIETRLPISTKLRSANGTALLSEAEWTELADCVRAAQWVAFNDETLALCLSVLDAEEITETPPRAERRRAAKAK
jgi:hypothetical protein